MKKAKTLKRVSAIMLTLALLAGMMSVMGAFPMTASAETENTSANKFVADFSELAALGGDLVTGEGYATAYTPSTDNATADGKMNNWMREKFATKTNYVYSTYRSWFGQLSDEISDKETTGWGGNGSTTGLRVHPDGLMQRVENVYATEMLRRVDTIIPQFNGENVQLKNFKATIKYRTRLQNYRGAIVVGFDETDAGYNVATNSTYLGTRRTVTGATLVLGNGSGSGNRGAGNGAAEKDGWVFYNRTGTISSTTVDEKRNDGVWHDLKLGETEGDFTVAGGQVMYKRFDTDSTQQWLTLTVEVKNGKATFTTTSEDGYRNETMEMAYDPRGGFFSIGMSDRDYIINYVDIVEYDENGNAVDFGTYHNGLKGVDKAVEIFEADFSDLPDLHYVNGQYLYNVNHDPSTGKGVGLTGTNGTTATSVAAYATSYKVDVKDKALVDYLESKFDFYTYANGGGGTFPMWNAAGYVVDAEGNPLGAGFASSNPYSPATGVAGGDYMPGSGKGGFAMSGYYPTMTLSGNKWFHIASDIGINARNPFDIVYSYALNNANGDKAVVKNFQLDLDFKLTHPGYGSYAHNQSPLFVKFGGYDSVTSGCTDGAMFAISHNGGYFLDDLNTAVNGSTFTATKNSDGSPAYTEYIGGAAATQKVGEAHLTLTVKNGTVNAVVTLADGTEVLNVTKNDISIQSGLIYIGTSYAGMNHGLPYFGGVKVVRLDNDGNPIDFTDGDEGSFDASFVGVTDVVGGKYYRNLGTKDTAILTGKSTPWLSNAVAIADVGDKDNDGYAFGAEDTNIVNYLNEKFDFYHAAPNGTVTQLATPYQNADEIYTDASYSGGQWKLAGGRWLRATFDNGVHWNDVFRKQMVLVPKMNGEVIKSKDLSIEFDMAHGKVNNGNSYSAALIMLRSAEVAKTQRAGNAYTDAIAVRITHKGITVYDGTAPANTNGHTNDDQFLYGGDIYNSHVYLDLNGDQLYLKVTSLDGATTYAEQTVTVANCMNAGYAYMSVCNSDIAFADIEIEPVAVAHTCEFNIPKYDETGHWNECTCGEKDEVVPHTLTGGYNDEGHADVCACGYMTNAAAHEFDNDCDTDCACGYTREVGEHNYATPNYDENGHWNECACGEKGEVVKHTMNGKYDEEGHWTACECGYATEKEFHSCKWINDGGKHYEACDCGYTTTPVDHDFTNGDCVCGEQAPNTAVVKDGVIVVKVAEGYELKAGSLLILGTDGNYYVPTRVGFQNGGNATQYALPEGVMVAEIKAEFKQFTDGELNIGIVGTSTQTELGALRFVYRANVSKEGDKLYMLYNGVKQEISEYGLLMASGSLVKDPTKLTLEKAQESYHIKEFAWPDTNVYYDYCDEYTDIAVKVTGITAFAGGADTKIYTRMYVKLADGTVVYDSVYSATYNDPAAIVAVQ